MTFNEKRITLNAKIKAASAFLFDFDGVIADSEESYFISYRDAFARIAHPLYQEEYVHYWTSLGLGVQAEMERHRLPYTGEIGDFIRNLRAEIFRGRAAAGQIKFFPEVSAIFGEIKKRFSQAAIASNSFKEDIECICQANFTPDLPLISRVPGLRPKPAPDVFLHAAKFLGQPPEKCLVIEDAYKGYLAAQEAKMPVIIVGTPWCESYRTKYPPDTLYFDNHAEFLRALQAV